MITLYNVVITTRSELSMFQRCEQRWYYGYVQSMAEQDIGSKTMAEGTLGHIGLAAAYAYMQECQETKKPLDLLQARVLARAAIDATIEKGTSTYHGEERKLPLSKNTDEEAIVRMKDVVCYYIDQQLESDYSRYKILGVEQTFTSVYTIMGYKIHVVGQMDLLAQDRSFTDAKIITVGDHKFIGDNIKGALGFLPKDLQMLMYEDMLVQRFIKTGEYQGVKILYDLARRECPPGYGYRVLRRNKDGSIAANNASQEPSDYLGRKTLWHSPREQAAIVANYIEPLLKAFLAHRVDEFPTSLPYMRRVIKTGGEACSNCFADKRCGYDLIGRSMPDFPTGNPVTGDERV